MPVEEADDDHGVGSIRSMFRSEIRGVLRPRKHDTRLSEIDGRVTELLQQHKASSTKAKGVNGFSSAFTPPPRASPATNGTAVVKRKVETCDSSVQVELVSHEAHGALVAALKTPCEASAGLCFAHWHSATRVTKRRKEIFAKYDRDGDDLFSRREIISYAQEELGFALPASAADRIATKLIVGTRKGVPFSAFKQLRNAIAEEREQLLENESEEPVAWEPFEKNCVYVETAPDVVAERKRVDGAQRLLHDLDAETQKLHRELKMCRIQTWKNQRDLSSKEHKIADLLPYSGKLLEEKENLDKEELTLSTQLREAQREASQWSSAAKRQDHMLQNERDQQKGGVYSSVFSKHPAGEIFLPPVQADNDSDDDDSMQDHPISYRREGGRGPGMGGGRGGGGVRRASGDRDDSDDLSDENVELSEKEEAAGSAPPRPPPQNFRSVGNDDDESEDISDTSSMPSPSNGSLSGSPAGSSAAKKPSGSLLKSKTNGRAESVSVSSEDSSDDDKAPGKKPAAASNSSTPSASPAAAAADKKVPPINMKTNEDSDYSSVDEDFEETSRSV